MFFNKLLIFPSPPPLIKLIVKYLKNVVIFFLKNYNKEIYFYFVSKLKKDILINQYFKLLAF